MQKTAMDRAVNTAAVAVAWTNAAEKFGARSRSHAVAFATQ